MVIPDLSVAIIRVNKVGELELFQACLLEFLG